MMMENSTSNAQAPPPSYQQEAQKPGNTYYAPPPPQPEANYLPPPVNNGYGGGINAGQRFTQFYAPPQNRSLGLKRRFCSFICCCIVIGLVVGLSVGLTRTSYYSSSSSCNCRTDSECIARFGSGTFCYSSCQCARR